MNAVKYCFPAILSVLVSPAIVVAQVSTIQARPVERVYISTSGDFLGASTIADGNLAYVDSGGALSLLARDYTDEIKYDYRNRLESIGTASVTYDFRGRVQQVGVTQIAYDFRDRVGQIGGAAIAYMPRGKVSQVGNVTLQYKRGHIETISANYTSTGVGVVIINRRD